MTTDRRRRDLGRLFDLPGSPGNGQGAPTGGGWGRDVKPPPANAPAGFLRLPVGVVNFSSASTVPGDLGALAPPAGARLTRREYRALIEARFKTHPGARQHLMTYARYLAPRESAAALVITGPYADVARAYLLGLAPQSS